MATRRAYPSDLSDAQWAILDPLLGGPASGRHLPHDLPNWNTVYWYFTRWINDGTWERVNDELRRRVRTQAGREAEPSAAIMDSQSVKTTEKGGTGATTPARK